MVVALTKKINKTCLNSRFLFCGHKRIYTFFKIPVDELDLVLYAISTMKMKRSNTNVQRITKFMNDHPLNQAFVLEALGRYANNVSANKATLIEQMKTSMISGEAWVASADAWIGIDPITVDRNRSRFASQ